MVDHPQDRNMFGPELSVPEQQSMTTQEAYPAESYEKLVKLAQNGNEDARFPSKLEQALTGTDTGHMILRSVEVDTNALEYTASVYSPLMRNQPNPFTAEAATQHVVGKLEVYGGFVDKVDEIKKKVSTSSYRV